METLNKLNEAGSGVDEKCSCKRGKWTVIMLALFLLAGIACWYIHHPNSNPQPTGSDSNSEINLKPGKYYTVMFRRDMLGGAENVGLPISPTTTAINSASVSVRGRLLDINHDALLLENTEGSRSLYWIPKNSILLIKIGESTTL